MSLHKLKSFARRGSLLGAAVALVIAAIVPASSAFADALNPLTQRSLTLSSSAPGWDSLDGSGNTTYTPPNSGANGKQTGNTFDFKVSTDTTSGPAVKGFSFQYCTASAGTCQAPGDDTTSHSSGAGTGTITIDTGTDATAVVGDGTTFTTQLVAGGSITVGGHTYTIASITDDTDLVLTAAASADATAASFTYDNGYTRGADDATHADLNVVAGSGSGHTPAELSGATFSSLFTAGQPNSVPNRNNTQGDYVVLYKDPDAGNTWTQSTGWVFTTTNNEDSLPITGTEATSATGKHNYITLTNSGTGLQIHTGTEVKVVFFATDNNYITNPGAGAFFVKINDYKSDSSLTSGNILDGGVTVANVMNQSIEIQTKVLETMDFSVGTVDPDTLSDAQLGAATAGTDNSITTHGQCDPILTGMLPSDPDNTLILGNTNAENSLSTNHTYSTHSYWRLSSNSSAGATVYYSGETLSNTEGDQIKPIGVDAAAPHPGTEQFGLALDNGGTPNYAVNYDEERGGSAGALGVYENGADNTAAGIAALNGTTPTGTGVSSDLASDWSTAGIVGKAPELLVRSSDSTALAPVPAVSHVSADYSKGTGVINGGDPTSPAYTGYGTINTQFAFDSNSNAVPTPLASESAAVVDCATAKVRYIANIAATTPAGIYTTKVNFIAAPQY